MKRFLSFVLPLLLLVSLAGCTGSTKPVTPDYTDAATFEAALNAGEDLTGKVVQFTVNELVPNSTFGYNLQAGEHLNFCSSTNPGAKAGDTVMVKVTAIQSILGSYIIKYDKVS